MAKVITQEEWKKAMDFGNELIGLAEGTILDFIKKEKDAYITFLGIDMFASSFVSVLINRLNPHKSNKECLRECQRIYNLYVDTTIEEIQEVKKYDTTGTDIH